MKDSSSTGVSFCEVLLIVFIILKLLGVITWSWVWVLAPFWIPAGLVTVVFLVMYIRIMISSLTENHRRKMWLKRTNSDTSK